MSATPRNKPANDEPSLVRIELHGPLSVFIVGADAAARLGEGMCELLRKLGIHTPGADDGGPAGKS